MWVIKKVKYQSCSLVPLLSGRCADRLRVSMATRPGFANKLPKKRRILIESYAGREKK